jgi:hypothetical protein
MPTGPSIGTNITLTYSYNRVPELLQAVIKTSKQVTTDVMVHQAGYRHLKVYLSIEYDRGFVVQQVNNAINERLKSYFAGMAYGSWIEMSDITQAVHQVLGVDNVKITKSTDPGVVSTNYGVKVFADSADIIPVQTYDNEDFKLHDDQLPLFLSAGIRRMANR